MESRRMFHICERINEEIRGEKGYYSRLATDLNEEEQGFYERVKKQMVEENEKVRKFCEENGYTFRPVLIPPVELDW